MKPSHTTQVWRWRGATLWRLATTALSFVAFVAVIAASLRATPAQQVTLLKAKELIQAAVSQDARQTGTLVDPRVVSDLAANLIGLTANFCDDVLEAPVCAETVAKPAVLRTAVAGYLRDVTTNLPTSVTSIAARLAAVAEEDLGKAGLPPFVTNEAGVIELPQQLWAFDIRVRTATNDMLLGRGKRIAAKAGAVLVSWRDSSGQDATASVVVPMRARVQLRTGQSPAATMPVGSVSATEDQFCGDERTPALGMKVGAPLVPFDFDRGVPGADSLAYRSPMTKAMALDIQVVDETSSCDTTCRRRLAASFVEAVAVWKTACQRCDANALAIVRVANHIWADSRIVQRTRRAVANARSPVLDMTRPDSLEPPASLTMPLVSYEELTGESDLLAALCRASPGDAPWIPDFQALGCGALSGRPSTKLRPRISLKPGDTTCGSADDFVACGLPGEGVEITVAGARWNTIRERQVLDLGSTQIAVPWIVFHEVGHWFGVPHSDDPGIGSRAARDIMAGTYGDGRPCVSGDTLTLMNNAADLRWQFRVTSGGGLRRPRKGAR